MSKKSRYIIPNFFTGISFMLGIFSTLIVTSFYIPFNEQDRIFIGKAPIIVAAWMICWCVCLDKLDGFAAKIMKASSDFGAQFDSLADLIAFGVAPCFLVYFYLQSASTDWSSHNRPLLIISLTVYVLCTAMRLARYNAIDGEELGAYFQGLPSTFAGGFVALSVILFDKYNFHLFHPNSYYILPFILIFMGLMMVSPFYLPKVVKRKNKWINIIQIIAVASGYLFGFGMKLPEYLIGILLVYGIGGFSFCILNKGMIEIQASG
ncbi:CDP-alcohol phosphatidyltransferase family protein [Fibrobacterota bacterium]